MKTRLSLLIAGVLLVAAGCWYFFLQTPPPESPQGVHHAAGPAEVELGGAAEKIPTTDLQRSPLAEKPSVGKSIVAGTNVLRVILEGISEEDAALTQVTLTGVDERREWPADLRDGWLCQGLTSEFPLDPFLARIEGQGEHVRPDELMIEVDHPLYLIARTKFSSGMLSKNGQTVYEVRVRMVPAAVIHGRLAREDGTPATQGLVGILRLEDDFPIEDVGHAVESAADGAFEIRVPSSGTYALASYEEGRRPTTTRVETLVGLRVDVGTLVVDLGHAITGSALRQGKPLAGASLSVTPPRWKTAATPAAIDLGLKESVYEGRTFATPDRSVHLLWLPPEFLSRANDSVPGSREHGRFELASQMVTTDENGNFVFRGLGAGEYLLRMRELANAHDALPGYWDDTGAKDLYRIHGERPALVVRAPERGIVFAFRWTSIRFELSGDLDLKDDGRLFLKTLSANPTPVDEDGNDLRSVADPLVKHLNFTPEYLTEEFSLPGGEPTYSLQAPPFKHILGEVIFSGRQPVSFEIWTPESGEEVVVPVELVTLEDAATLVIKLENPPEEIPEAFSVKLWRADQTDGLPDTRPVVLAAGQLRVEGIFPGKYRVRVHAGEGNRAAGLFHEQEFDLALPPGLETTRSIRLYRGSGIRFTVRGDDGALLGGEYEFYDNSDLQVELDVHVLENKRQATSWNIYPSGTHESFNELHPGRYRLVLRSPGYAEKSVTLELRAGEYEVVDVILAR